MSSETQIILRHSAPSLLDSLPYGTACKVTKEDKFDLYCQTNKNEHEYPNWMFIGTFDKEVGQFIIHEEINFVLGKSWNIYLYHG